MYCYLLLLISLHQTCGVYLYPPFRGGYPKPVYSRDVDTNDIDSRISSIQDRINILIEQAESDNGISLGDLQTQVQDLKELTESILNQLNINVSVEEVKRLIHEIVTEYTVIPVTSFVVIDAVTYQALDMNVTLQLLERLCDILRTQQDATVKILIEKPNYQRSLFQRQWSGSVNGGYDPTNGAGAGFDVKYTKGNWEFGANGGWNQRQGGNYGLGFTYRFKK